MKIKPKTQMLIDRWESVVIAILLSHYRDGMTIDDFMSLHPKSPRSIIQMIFDRLIQTNQVILVP